MEDLPADHIGLSTNNGVYFQAASSSDMKLHFSILATGPLFNLNLSSEHVMAPND